MTARGTHVRQLSPALLTALTHPARSPHVPGTSPAWCRRAWRGAVELRRVGVAGGGDARHVRAVRVRVHDDGEHGAGVIDVERIIAGVLRAERAVLALGAEISHRRRGGERAGARRAAGAGLGVQVAGVKRGAPGGAIVPHHGLHRRACAREARVAPGYRSSLNQSPRDVESIITGLQPCHGVLPRHQRHAISP